MGHTRPLVGREPALGALRAGVQAAAGGRGEFALVSGEPGIGKTALVGALAIEVVNADGLVLWGQCWEGDGAPAYWPWVQVVRAGLAAGGNAAEELTRLLPEAAKSAPPSGAAPLDDRFRLFDAMARFLTGLATHRPVLVVLDDLQWADDASLVMAEFCARHLQATGVLLVGTYRDEEATAAVRRLAAAARLVPLGGLSVGEAARLFSDVAGVEPQPALAEMVWRRTGGNPLFVGELARLLTATGDLHAAAGERAVVPASVREVIERRLARLSQSCAGMLGVAAVCGQEIDAELLRHLVHDAELPRLLDEALAARILTERGQSGGGFRFVHDLIREVVLSGLPTHTLTSLHRAAAEALDDLAAAGRRVHPAELAAHWVAAAADGDTATAARAVGAAEAAAADATARLAYEDACEHLGRALAVLDARPATDVAVRRIDVQVRLGEAYARAGDATRARGTLGEAAARARGSRDATGLARSAIGVHRLGAPTGLSHGDNIALLEEAAGALTGQHSALRARVLASLARDLHHSWEQPNMERAVGVAEEAVAIAEAVDDPATLAFCLLALHDALWRSGTATTRRAIIDRMLNAATACGDRELIAQARLLRAAGLIELGDPAGRQELDEYCRLAEELGDARSRWGAVSRRATLGLIAGRIDEAWALRDEALRLGESIGEPDTYAVYGTLGWEIARFRPEGRADLNPLDHGEAVGLGGTPQEATKAIQLAESGDLQAARRTLADLRDVPELRPGVPVSHDPWPLVFAAEAAALAGSEELRERCLEHLAPLSGTHTVVGGCAAYAGAVDHYTGLLTRSLGRIDEARRHFELAAELHHRLGAPAWAELSRAEAKACLPTPTEVRCVFRRDGDIWTITYRGRQAHLPDVKGLRDLAVLLARPGQEVHAVELHTGRAPQTGADPVLDETAKAAYRRRLAELESDIEDAESNHDTYRAEQARAERGALIAELSAAVGLGGRNRRLGDERERARKAVTARIREAIDRIERANRQLGHHLRSNVRTGTWCAYTPSESIHWEL